MAIKVKELMTASREITVIVSLYLMKDILDEYKWSFWGLVILTKFTALFDNYIVTDSCPIFCECERQIKKKEFLLLVDILSYKISLVIFSPLVTVCHFVIYSLELICQMILHENYNVIYCFSKVLCHISLLKSVCCIFL